MTLTALLDSTIDHIGDWNPQLFRELKGRLTARSLLITAVFVSSLYGWISVKSLRTQLHQWGRAEPGAIAPS